jgi:Domain of unknown function (DUF4399)
MSKLTRRAFAAVAALMLAALLLPPPVHAQEAAPPKAPKDAYLYIIWPNNHERIRGGFWIRFGLRHMGVAPAGTTTANTGHHHLFIDDNEPIKAGDTIPADKKHLHFGAGQTEARLDLPRGTHTLQLVLGDGQHRIFDPPVVSKKITITVR